VRLLLNWEKLLNASVILLVILFVVLFVALIIVGKANSFDFFYPSVSGEDLLAVGRISLPFV